MLVPKPKTMRNRLFFYAGRRSTSRRWCQRSSAGTNKTNMLRFTEGFPHGPPWKAPMHQRQKNTEATWLYCDGCHRQLFRGSTPSTPTVPFRDKFSAETIQNANSSSESPGGKRPSQIKGAEPTAFASTAQKKKQVWQRRFKQAAKNNIHKGLRISSGLNLIPAPKAQYWQNTPEARFAWLMSDEAKGQLSCVNLRSAMVEHQDERGRAAYACARGAPVGAARRHSWAASFVRRLGRERSLSRDHPCANR